MRLVIQRVQSASVSIDGKMVSEIGKGLLVLVGIETGDTEEDMKWLVGKTAGLRIFNDENGVMNRSVLDVAGDVLAVSQFTLTASTKKRTSALRGTSWQFLSTKHIVTALRPIWAAPSAEEFSALICRSR